MRQKMPAALALLVLASGCTTITPEQQRAADEAECRSYGFTRRNDAFAQCLQRLDLDRRAQRRADMLAMQPSWPDPPIYRPVIVYPAGK
ncbi:MAG: hypothetical protein J0H34_11085 [Rhizobiales bacterium]|nr:hypothetical protein [Hyphomicrobiales bacterium]